MNQLHQMRDERIAQRSKATQSITPNFHALSPFEACVNSSTLTCTLQSSRARRSPIIVCLCLATNDFAVCCLMLLSDRHQHLNSSQFSDRNVFVGVNGVASRCNPLTLVGRRAAHGLSKTF
jgi:hypothetical protein